MICAILYVLYTCISSEAEYAKLLEQSKKYNVTDFSSCLSTPRPCDSILFLQIYANFYAKNVFFLV